jgi:polyferredoxin
MAITDLIPGIAEIRMVFAGAVLAVVVGAGWYAYHIYEEVGVLQTANAQYLANQKTLEANQLTCTSANKTNEATIAALTAERQQSQQAIATLAATAKINVDNLSAVSAKLATLMKSPANNGTLSPDLRETIRGLQTPSAMGVKK